MLNQRCKYSTPYYIMIFITSLLGVGILNANAAENEKGYMDPRAIEVLKNASDFIGKAKTLAIKATAIYDHVMESGIIVTYSKEVEVYVKRPNKFLVVIRSDDYKQRRIYFDGKSVVRFNVNKNSYHKVPYAGNIDGVLDHIIDNYDVDLPLADLIYNDIAGVLQESIISAEHMGERIIDGMPCHHLSYESTGADWQVWVQKWEKPVPRRFAINYVNIDGSPQFLAMLKEWQINPTLDEKIFTFNPPFGAKESELMKAVGSKKVN